MNKHHKEEAAILFKHGHTFYGIVYQLKMWFNTVYTEAQVKKALGGVENNPVGHKKLRKGS